MSTLKEVASRLRDLPITKERKGWFVDREESLRALETLSQLYEGSIVGITGERGIGKSSLLNMFVPPARKVVIHVRNRETKLTVLKDIAYGLYLFAKDIRREDVAARLKSLIGNIDAVVKDQLSIGLSTIVNLSFARERERREDVVEVAEELALAVEMLSDESLVVVLDEIDKEREEELLLTLDAVKVAFLDAPVTLFVSLPPGFGEIYRRGREGVDEVYNLENVIKKVVELGPLSDRAQVEMVEKRAGVSLEEFVEEAAKELALEYAAGNPRKFLLSLKEGAFEALMAGKERIEKNHVLAAIAPYIRSYLESKDITEKEWALLRHLHNGSVAENAKAALKAGFSRPLFYKYLYRLEEKGLITLQAGHLRVDARVAIALREGLLPLS